MNGSRLPAPSLLDNFLNENFSRAPRHWVVLLPCICENLPTASRKELGTTAVSEMSGLHPDQNLVLTVSIMFVTLLDSV